MDRLPVSGGPVLEQLSQPCDSFGRNAAFLLSYVKGEYEDEDGDWATGFIVADPKPCSKTTLLHGPLLNTCGQLSVLSCPEIMCRNGSEEPLQTMPLSTDSTVRDKDGSESFRCFHCRDGHQINVSDAVNPLEVDHKFCSWDDVTEFGGSPSSGHSLSSVDDVEETNATNGISRKLQLDRASSIAYQAEGYFSCETCGKTQPLHAVFPSLSCDCLVCNSCCRLHVEQMLSLATRRPVDGKLPTLGLQDFEPQDELANRSKDETNRMADGESFDRFIEAKEPYFKVRETAASTYDSGYGQFEELLSGEVRSCLETISCPTRSCSGCLQLSEAQVLAPEAFQRWEEAASLDLLDHCTSYINCPGCDIHIEKVASELPLNIAFSGVPELDKTLPFIELDHGGKQLSRSALCHRAEHRFRCSMCSVDFCGQCRTVPYHLGKTCEEFEDEKNSIRCPYCDVPVRSKRHDETLSTLSVRELRKELDRDDVDALWCMEKKDLVAVHRFASSVCSSRECRRLLQVACTQNLECGHHCGGVRGERQCLPCLEDDCRQKVHMGTHVLPSVEDLCAICMVEPLHRAPAIQLKCGHVVHFCCALKKLEEGFPGPAISFGYLNCPQCSQQMQHASLDLYMQEPLALLEQVRKKAITRLKMEGLFVSAKELKAGGRFEGKPTDFALQLYQYYICSKCKAPYFGGLRECGANDREQIGDAHNPLNLICGGCSASSRGQGLCTKGHGKEFVEFKCKFCCSIATYFCFGDTHFCEYCHRTRPDGQPNITLVQCRGPKYCPLSVSHAPNGQECCLGCSMCRLRGQ